LECGSASTRLAIRWSTAKEAITRLRDAKLIKCVKASPRTRPRYTLAKKGELIWLPNTLDDGVGNETAPLTKLRQTQDPMVSRLLVELYGEQNLREDGGISPKVTWQTYERERVAERGTYVVWEFSFPKQWVSWGEITRPHWHGGEDPGKGFFRRFGHLQRLGLVEWIPYLFEGPNGEPLHALRAAGDAVEHELYCACTEAAERCLVEWQEGGVRRRSPDVVVPVAAHIDQVTLVGIARLRYRPHTRLTSAWWADHNARNQHYIEYYNRIRNNAI
jgi:hypothetical protein